jgi:hypothetical protein
MVSADELTQIYQAFESSVTYGNFKSELGSNKAMSKLCDVAHSIWSIWAAKFGGAYQGISKQRSLLPDDWYSRTFGEPRSSGSVSHPLDDVDPPSRAYIDVDEPSSDDHSFQEWVKSESPLSYADWQEDRKGGHTFKVGDEIRGTLTQQRFAVIALLSDGRMTVQKEDGVSFDAYPEYFVLAGVKSEDKPTGSAAKLYRDYQKSGSKLSYREWKLKFGAIPKKLQPALWSE